MKRQSKGKGKRKANYTYKKSKDTQPQPWQPKYSFYSWLGVVMILPLAYFVFDRIQFSRRSQQTTAIVERLSSENGECMKRRWPRSCTKYHATLRHEVNGREYRIIVPAGGVLGHDQPVKYARYRIGDREDVKYDPRRPARAYRNWVWDVWGAPILTLFGQIALFVAGWKEKQLEKESGVR